MLAMMQGCLGKGSRPGVHGASDEPERIKLRSIAILKANRLGYLERAARTRWIIVNGRNLARFPFPGCRPSDRGTEGKILHGRIVAFIPAWLAAASGDSGLPMSWPLTRLTLRSVMLCVLQCETAGSRKEIRDVVRQGLYSSNPKMRSPYGRKKN